MISAALLSVALLQPAKFPTCQSGASRAAVAGLAADTTSTRRDFVSTTGASAALAALMPAPVFAESTLVTRQQAYSRYVPRIERGRDYWATGLKKQVAAQDWQGISAALDKKGSIDRIFGPMELWASSWSSKTISDKTLAMNVAINELREAARGLKLASEGKEKGGGFLGFGGNKVMDPSKRTQLAQAAYAKGVQAINKYIDIGNDGLGMNFAQIDTI